MGTRAALLLAVGLAASMLGACASRPVNAPLHEFDRRAGYRYENRAERPDNDPSTVVVLAFSGGGMRAAAFSYGVLEELRRTEVVLNGKRTRLLDQVDLVTGVSGGSFTALAFGLQGERLFDGYEQRFLKHDVQGDLVARLLAPTSWAPLMSEGWGRSEMAAQLYDELLFEHKTFADLAATPGPMILATATDISTGSRLAFSQSDFDLICSDLSSVPVSRAAAASSAVPLVMSPVTLNNFGGTCKFTPPYWLRQFQDPGNRLRPAGRALQRIKEMNAYEDGANRPYLHLVDGGLSDNLGLRAIIESLESIEASAALRQSTRIGKIRRVVVLVVNSLSVPATSWDRSERPPNDLQILLKATGVPIDRYSYEAVELLKDIVARWNTIRELRDAGTLAGARDASGRPIDAPNIDLYAIDVSIEAHPDPKEREFLNETPTSWRLTDEQVDRLRAAPAAILHSSGEFKRLLDDLGATVKREGVAP